LRRADASPRRNRELNERVSACMRVCMCVREREKERERERERENETNV